MRSKTNPGALRSQLGTGDERRNRREVTGGGVDEDVEVSQGDLLLGERRGRLVNKGRDL